MVRVNVSQNIALILVIIALYIYYIYFIPNTGTEVGAN